MNHPPAHTRSTEIIRGIGALTALVILLAGVPVGLAAVGGSPIPHALPDWEQITTTLTQPDTGNTLFLVVIKVIGWMAWCLFTLITLTETAAYRRRRPPRRLPGAIRPIQHLARDLVAMAALIVTATAPTLGSAGSTAATLNHPSVAAVTAMLASETVSTSPAATPSAFQRPFQSAHHTTDTAPAQRWRTRTIKRGDTLWAIARATTGSGAKYPAIFNASKHLTQPHGLPSLTDPDRIYPGQHLKTPASETTTGHPSHQARPPAGTPQRPQPSPPTASPTAPKHSPAPGTTPPHVTPPPTTVPPRVSQAPALSPPAAPVTPPAPERGPVPDPPPGSRPATPTHPSTASAAPAPSADTWLRQTPQPPDRRHHAAGTVTLSTGAYLSIGLATAISIALAATRLHRRRRRSSTTEWPTPAEPATPTAVAKVRKTHLDTFTEKGTPLPTDADLLARDATEPAPTDITAGTRDGAEINLELSGLSLGLTGPGATAVARAWMTELLAKSSRYRVELLIPEPDATTLLAGSGLDITELAHAVPGLVIVGSLQAAITHLESEFIHRARLMETADEPNVHALRHTDPGEPLPAIILLAAAPTSSEALEAILALSAPYGLGALLLGTWTAGTTVHVSADGTVTRAEGPTASTWTTSRLFNLGLAETAEMLQVVRTASGAPEHAPADPSTSTPTRAPVTTEPTRISSPAPSPAAGIGPMPGKATAAPSVPEQLAGPDNQETIRPVRLSVLGPVRLATTDSPITTGLRRITRDLLAYLALHPDGVTREQGVDALMPDRDLAAGTTMLHTAINNARKTLRQATGLREAMFIIHADGRYRLDPHLIDVDLWQLHATLDRAHHAETDSSRINQLRHIPDLYVAELAEDLTYEWAETERENLRRHATDALSQLAQLTRKTHPDRAITALETAINHDPYAEPIYRDLMRIQATADRPDAVRRTYDQLKRRLADLDTEPDGQTHQLLLTLLRRHTSASEPPGKTPPAPNRPTAHRHPASPTNSTATVRPLRSRNPE